MLVLKPVYGIISKVWVLDKVVSEKVQYVVAGNGGAVPGIIVLKLPPSVQIKSLKNGQNYNPYG